MSDDRHSHQVATNSHIVILMSLEPTSIYGTQIYADFHRLLSADLSVNLCGGPVRQCFVVDLTGEPPGFYCVLFNCMI